MNQIELTCAQRIRAITAAVFAIVTMFSVSASTVPLMSRFAEEFSLTRGVIALTAVSYFIGCVVALLVLNRLSNRFGRKPIVCLAVLMSGLSCLMLIDAGSGTTLICARFLQGLACGMASSCAMAWILDATPAKHMGLGIAVASGSPNMSFMTGALFVLVAADVCAASVPTVYIMLTCITVAVILFTLAGTETILKPTQTLKEVLTPSCSVPSRLTGTFFIASSITIGVWSTGGYFFAYSAILAQKLFASSSMAYSTMIFVAGLSTFFFGGLIVKKTAVRKGLYVCLSLFVLTFAGLWASLANTGGTAFIVCSIVNGTMVGSVTALAIRALTHDVVQSERSSVLSALYLAGYAGVSVPPLAIGLTGNALSIESITLVYLVWVSVLALIAMPLIRKLR